MSDGVTAWIVLVSVGGVSASFFTDERSLPWALLHEHGDSHVTSYGAAAAVPQRKATAIVNVARIICACSYHFVVAVWRAKEAQSAGEVLGNHAGRAIWLVDAHRDGKRFVVRADEIWTAFLELEAAVCKPQGKLKSKAQKSDSYTESARFGVVLSAKRKA
jgi:hypothetical protein